MNGAKASYGSNSLGLEPTHPDTKMQELFGHNLNGFQSAKVLHGAMTN